MISIYIVSSWIMLQVISVTWQALGLPSQSMTYLIVFLLLGFPTYIFFVWKLRLNRLEKIRVFVDEEGKPKASPFKRMYFSGLGIISAISTLTIFFILGNSITKATDIPVYIKSNKIAVLGFGNNTGNPKYDIVSKMTADWIIHGITENHLAEVISPEVISNYNSMFKSGKSNKREEAVVLQEHLQPSKIISGNFYLNQGKMVFQSTIIDGKSNDILISFETDPCSPGDSMSCIKDIEESITGYLATEGKKELMLQDDPPKYEAYRYLLEAKSTDNKKEYLELLNKSLQADPDFFEPKVLRVAYFYNLQNYREADSLLKLIKPDSYQNKRQMNLLNMYKAILQGNNKQVYETILKEFKIAPFDLQSNKTAMVVALQFVNRPEVVDKIFRAIKLDSMDFENCEDCVQRIYVKALADIQLKEYALAIQLIQKTLEQTKADLLSAPLITALVRSGKDPQVTEFFTNLEVSTSAMDLQRLYLVAGKEFILKGKSPEAKEYFGKAKALFPQTLDKQNLADALFGLQDYNHAKRQYELLHNAFPNNLEYLGKLAISNYASQHKMEAARNIEDLKKLRGDYQFGELDYILAEYDAISGNEEGVYRNLLKATASGFLFTPYAFQNDPLFSKYVHSKKFDSILTYWH